MHSLVRIHSTHRGYAAVKLVCLLAAGTLFASLVQSAIQIIGQVPVENANNNMFNASMTNTKAFYVPFAFNAIGDYSLDTVKLLLKGDAELADISVMATSTLGTDLTVPTALVNFSASGTLSGTDTAYDFSPLASSNLLEGVTYYLRIANTGMSSVSWVFGSTLGNGENPFTSGAPFTPLVTQLTPDDPYSYREITNSSFTNEYRRPGLSIAAAAVPEPLTFAGMTGGLTLCGALLVRLRRARVAA